MPRSDPKNATRYWFDPRLRGLSLLAADFQTHEYPTHTHDALLVAVTETGGSEIKAGGVPGEIDAAALLVVNPDEPHSSRMLRSRRWRYRSLYLDVDGLDVVADALGLPSLPFPFPSFDENVFHEHDLIQDFLDLHQGLEARRDPLRERELLFGAFGGLVRRHGRERRRVLDAPGDRRLLDRVLRTIRERHAGRLTLEDLSAPLGLTQYQLIRLVKRGIGMTPHSYLTQVRLDVARDLLRRRVALADVAQLSGFYDQAALTRHFKRALAITPLQYRRALGASPAASDPA